MKIFVDAMGGDNAPQCTVEGTIEALRKYPDMTIVLGGDLPKVEPYLKDCDDVRARIELCDAPEIISNDESPVMGVRKKKSSATVKGMTMLKNNEVDGFVSAGSTGANMFAAMAIAKCVEGIDRPALAPLMPNGKGYFLLVDCGANVDCLPEYLVQFGIMGDAYMRGVMGMKEPRVGLINIGAEAHKGNKLVKEAYPLLENGPFRFVGNVEAREITRDQADVMVCDGFSGNLVLKFMEGLSSTLLGIIKKEMYGDLRSKIGGLLAKPAFRRVKKLMDTDEIGGAPMLGVRGAVVKAHGSSNGHAFASAIGQVKKMVDGDVVGIIERQVRLLQKTEA